MKLFVNCVFIFFLVFVLSLSTKAMGLLDVVLHSEIPSLPLSTSTSDNSPDLYEEMEESFSLKVSNDKLLWYLPFISSDLIIFSKIVSIVSTYHAEIFIPPQDYKFS